MSKMEEVCKISYYPEDVEGAQDTGNNSGDKYIKVKMPINNLMTELFKGSNMEELIQGMFISRWK